MWRWRTRDAIYDWDLRTNRVWRNEAYQQFYAPNEPVGIDATWWEQHIHADDRERILESIQQAFGHRNSFWSDGYRFRRFDGSIACVIDRGYILYNNQGPLRMIGAMTDVTREREIDRMKNEFISTAAHELRTPLTTVMGYIQLLQQEEARFTAEERKEFLALVYEKSEVLDRIIRDLLDLSRVQAGKLVTVDKVHEDLATVVRHAIAVYQGISSQHVFRLEFPDGAVKLCFDPDKMGQVLDNLFSNAVKFSPGGGSIRVSGRRTAGDFEVTVQDEGIGMHPEEAARIFDKFFRADASNTAISGLGLGMSIVKNIIEAHGGRIWVESEPGRGTQVHFTLPMEGEHCPDRQQS